MDSVEELLAVMRTLRDPERGCPWDVKQTFRTIAPFTIEEAYEVADAIERGDMEDLRDELGDLLLQVVYHARMAEESEAFRFEDVVVALTAKLVRRHPHVFGDDAERRNPPSWETIKAQERQDRAAPDAPVSVLDGIGVALPGLIRAGKLTRRAARVGFDWPSADGVFAKIDEELTELREAQASGDPGAIEEEFGDLLFACTNLARHLDVDPESALRVANGKFERRFRRLETTIQAEGRNLHDADMADKEAVWQRAKREEQQ